MTGPLAVAVAATSFRRREGLLRIDPARREWGLEPAGRSGHARDWVVDTVSNASAHLVGAATYADWESLRSAGWGETTIAAGGLADAITRLKQERSGGYLLAQGGVRFARSLLETGLSDECRLVVHPVVLGGGERRFTAPVPIEPAHP